MLTRIFFIIFSLVVSQAVVSEVSGPEYNNSGSYSINSSHRMGSWPRFYAIQTERLIERKNGVFTRYFVFDDRYPSESINVASTGVYTYELQVTARVCISELDGKLPPQCETWGRPETFNKGDHSVNVAFKPNTPPSIGYKSGTVESGSTDTNGQFTIEWGASSEGPLVSGYQWCQEKNGKWQSESSCLKVSSSIRSRALPSTGTMPSGQYRYKVRAYAKAGNYYQYSSWRTSPTIQVKYIPGKVNRWEEPGGSTLPGPSFTLKWGSVFDPHASDRITHYQLQWSVKNSGYSYVPFVGSLDGSNLGKRTSVTISKAGTGRDITAAIYKFGVVQNRVPLQTRHNAQTLSIQPNIQSHYFPYNEATVSPLQESYL